MKFESFGGTTGEAVKAFAIANRLALPDDYRAFPQRHNGGVPRDLACAVVGLRQPVLVEALLGVGLPERDLDLQTWHDEYVDEMPAGCVIAALGSGSALFLLVPPDAGSGDGGGVYCWDHAHTCSGSSEEAGNTYFVASTFEEFLVSLNRLTLRGSLRC